MRGFNTPIFTLAGILFGWLLTQSGQWFKSKKEVNRVRNQVLFNLLEILLDGMFAQIDLIKKD